MFENPLMAHAINVAHVPFNDTFPVIFKDLSFLYEDVI
jgi:hypothetical protein